MPLTAVGTVATGDFIQAATQNTMRDNDLALDARTGGDPGGAGKSLESTGTLGAAWVGGKVARAGDTMTGELTMTSGFGLTLGGAGSGRLYDQDTIATILRANSHSFRVFTANLLAEIFNATYGAAAPTFMGQTMYHSGNLPAIGAYVPSGLIAAFATAAAIASGWARYTALNGRMPVGAGTTFSTTFAEGTDYGASWSHGGDAISLTVGGTASSPTSTQQANPSSPGTSFVTSTATYSMSGGATGVTPTATWVIPSRAVVYAQKS